MKIYRLSSNFTTEIAHMEAEGYSLVDQKSIGDYTIFLLQSINPRNNKPVYQLGLTALDNMFSTPESQQKIQPNYPLKFSLLKDLINAIKEWMNQYPVMFVGSLNQAKTTKYHHILSKFFHTSNIINQKATKKHPEAWYFSIA